VIFNPPLHDYLGPRVKHPADLAGYGRQSEQRRISAGPVAALKLLHYRFLSPSYAAARNARQYERVGADKGPAWACAPDRDGEAFPRRGFVALCTLRAMSVDLNACYPAGTPLDA